MSLSAVRCFHLCFHTLLTSPLSFSTCVPGMMFVMWVYETKERCECPPVLLFSEPVSTQQEAGQLSRVSFCFRCISTQWCKHICQVPGCCLKQDSLLNTGKSQGAKVIHAQSPRYLYDAPMWTCIHPPITDPAQGHSQLAAYPGNRGAHWCYSSFQSWPTKEFVSVCNWRRFADSRGYLCSDSLTVTSSA